MGLEVGSMGDSPTSPAGGGHTRQLLREFLAVQARRTELYNRFDAGFRRYLQTRQEGIYRKLMAELTAEFADVSAQVRALEASLLLQGASAGGDSARSSGAAGCGSDNGAAGGSGAAGSTHAAGAAALLRGVQEAEREKLRLTLALQALKGAYARGQFSWQQPDERPALAGASSDAAGEKTGGAGLAMLHSGGVHACGGGGHAHEGGGGHGPACSHGCGPPPEPTEAEYNGAVAEAYRELQAAVVAINDLLDEVRGTVEELDEV